MLKRAKGLWTISQVERRHAGYFSRLILISFATDLNPPRSVQSVSEFPRLDFISARQAALETAHKVTGDCRPRSSLRFRHFAGGHIGSTKTSAICLQSRRSGCNQPMDRAVKNSMMYLGSLPRAVFAGIILTMLAAPLAGAQTRTL